MSKVGIFGGAFNPIHKGHTELARAAFRILKLNEMLIIPTAQSPHKQTSDVSFEDRAEMCRIAFENDKNASRNLWNEKVEITQSFCDKIIKALEEVEEIW